MYHGCCGGFVGADGLVKEQFKIFFFFEKKKKHNTPNLSFK